MKIRGATITTPIARSAVADDKSVSNKPWSSKNTVDMLCPSFTESGSIVTCEPVEGYPLEVTAEEGATITRCGKNFFGGDALADAIVSRGGTKYADTGIATFVSTNIQHRTIPLFAKFKENTQYTFVFYGKLVGSTYEINHFNLRVNYTDGTNYELKGTTPNTDEYVHFTSPAGKTVKGIYVIAYGGRTELKYDQCGVFEGVISLEEFETYKGDTFTPGEAITALPGVNTIYADAGIVTVNGKADPTAIINKLTNAVLAMGSNV